MNFSVYQGWQLVYSLLWIVMNLISRQQIYIPIWLTIWICGRKFLFTTSFWRNFSSNRSWPCVNGFYTRLGERKWILGVSFTHGNVNFTNFFLKVQISVSLHFFRRFLLFFFVKARQLRSANQSERVSVSNSIRWLVGRLFVFADQSATSSWLAIRRLFDKNRPACELKTKI